MIAYAITDPTTLDFNQLEKDLKRFASKASMIVYRDKETPHYQHNAKEFLASAKYFEKVLLHGDYLLASSLKADGVHLTSMQMLDIKKAKTLNLFVVMSTHTLEEVKQAELEGADMVTFSPIFDTPNKGKTHGIKMLYNIINSVSIPVIALGGITTQEKIDSCANVGTSGFASIRYFAKDDLSSL